MPPEQHPHSFLKDPRYVFAIAAVAIILVATLAMFYMETEVAMPVQPEAPVIAQPAPVIQEEESLGGALYEKANNPLEDKLPEQSPVANPINDAYKNPF